MTEVVASYVEIDGFKCYAPDLIDDASTYPPEAFAISVAAEASSFWCRSRNRIIRNAIQRFMPRDPPVEMLEIGCGIGGVVAELRQMRGVRLTASEVSLHGLRFARARFPDVDFVQLDATDMPFQNRFDVVGAFDVLEHIDEDVKAIAGARDALRRRGLFAVTVPQCPWLWSTLDDVVHHKRRYTRRELRGKLEAHGFDFLFCSSFVTLLFPAMAVSRLFSRIGRKQIDPVAQFASQVTLPALANAVCDVLMRPEEYALRAGVPLPFGGSLLALARKR